MIFVFLGPPGCGKGTQASRLSARFKLVHFDMGKVIRNEIEEGTSIGKTAKTFTNRGELVPLTLIKILLKKELEQSGERDMIMDGFPRSSEQAELLDGMLSDTEDELKNVYYFAIDERLLVNRIVNRRYCPLCKRVYNLLYVQPLEKGVCDDDGTSLQLRPDDNREVVMNRFRVYERKTEPILERYRKAGLIVEIDAGRNIDEIEETLVGAMGLN